MDRDAGRGTQGDRGAADERRFRALYDDHYRRVFAYARRRVASLADANDVVAETYTIAWRRLDVIHDDAAVTWLIGTAHKVVADQRRGQARRRRLGERLSQEPPVPDADGDADARIAGADDLDALGRALKQLSDVDRDVLLLTTWEQMPHAQVAEILGVATATVAVRLHRARKRLGQTYTKELGLAGHQPGEHHGEHGDDQ